MYDDDFLDRLLNSSGDDLDRLIQHDRDLRKQRHHHEGIEVDMSDIERLLNSSSPQKVVSVDSNYPTTEPPSEDYFNAIYAQLTEDYPIDRLSAVQLHSHRERLLRRVTWAILLALALVVVVVGILLILS